MTTQGLTNVAIIYPSDNVRSLSDELASGKVKRAIDAAHVAYDGLDSDNDVPEHAYDGDFLGAARVATQVARDSKGSDLLVLVVDGVLLNNADRNKVEQQLTALVADGNGIVILDVNDQPTAEINAWFKRLDNDGLTQEIDRIDVLKLDELPGDEVKSWFN